MGEFKAVITAADFLEELAGLIELEQPRIGAAMKDEDMTLRVCRDCDRFAEIFAGWEFQKVRHRRVFNLRHIFDSCLSLCERSCGGEYDQHHRQGQNPFHKAS